MRRTSPACRRGARDISSSAGRVSVAQGTDHGMWVVGGLATAFLLVWLLTAGDAAAMRGPRSDPEALRMLGDAAGAARSTAYEGVQVTTTWSAGRPATSQARISHTARAGSFVRGSAVDRVGTTAETSGDEVRGGLGGFTGDMLDLLTRNYSVVRVQDAAVCGRTAHVIEARREDGSAAGRFWIDRDTGLMLSRQLLDRQGRAANTTGFDSLRVKGPGQVARTPLGALSAPGQVLGDADLGRLREGGWTLPRSLPGDLTLREARRSAGVVHLSYSDGLSNVSVFVQPGVLDERRFTRWRRAVRDGGPVYESAGLQRWAVWGNRGYVYTVLADAPEGTSDAVVNALPHGHEGFLRRLARGFGRLNPFS